MSQLIGRQDGIDWFVAFVRKIPGVKYRPLGDRPLSLEQWYGLEKFERTIRILKDDHDAAVITPAPIPKPPPPEPKPPTTYKVVAPKVTNKQGGSDSDFCCVNQPGVVWSVNHPLGPCYVDDVARYDSNGLHLGGRSDSCTQGETPGLVGARERDGREPCSLPRVGDPQKNTGSWEV